MAKKIYTEEQKAAALTKVAEIGITKASKELGISVATLNAWKKAVSGDAPAKKESTKKDAAKKAAPKKKAAAKKAAPKKAAKAVKTPLYMHNLYEGATFGITELVSYITKYIKKFSFSCHIFFCRFVMLL